MAALGQQTFAFKLLRFILSLELSLESVLKCALKLYFSEYFNGLLCIFKIVEKCCTIYSVFYVVGVGWD